MSLILDCKYVSWSIGHSERWKDGEGGIEEDEKGYE